MRRATARANRMIAVWSATLATSVALRALGTVG